MTLGISLQEQEHWNFILVCLFKAIWRNYILCAPARTIQNVCRESQFIQRSHKGTNLTLVSIEMTWCAGLVKVVLRI